MKQQLNRFWEYIVAKTIEERQNLLDCKDDVVAKNYQILTTMVFAVAIIMSSSFAVSFFSDFFTSAGVSNLRWAYLGISIVAIAMLIYLKIFANKSHAILIYFVNTLGFAYAFIIGAFVAPHSTSVTFIIMLFMASTLYLDYGWRIHSYMIIVTVVYVVLIFFFKEPEAFAAEAMNSFIVLGLLFVIGTIVRSARLGIFVAWNKVQHLAYVDQLTGVSNRRKMFEDFGEFEQEKATQRITALAILDIDFFKRYNDRYGHQFGDVCLNKIGGCFLALEEKFSVRCYRYGGEEFTLSFVDCDKQMVNEIIDTLFKMVKDLKIPHSGSDFNFLTVSIGLAQNFEQEGEPKFEAMLSVADKALYEAKETGRNKIVCERFKSDKGQDLDTIRKRSGI